MHGKDLTFVWFWLRAGYTGGVKIIHYQIFHNDGELKRTVLYFRSIFHDSTVPRLGIKKQNSAAAAEVICN